MRIGLHGAEPTAIAESHGVHDKRIAVPLATEYPSHVGSASLISGRRRSVREDLTENHADVGLVQEWR